MSNIRYDIWGAPETWEEWSDSPVSNAIWGNMRVGASDYTNSDFTNYPQFKLGGTNQSLRTKINAGDISLNTPLDNSIAYTAIANPELPQLNVGLFGKGHTSVNNPFAVRDNSSPIPFCFAYLNDLNYTYFNMSRYQQLLGFDGFPDNATVIGQQSLQRWSPYATMNVSSSTTQYEYNQEGQIMPVMSFGIKSVIFEIIIVYNDYDNISAKANLKTYLNNTDTWLQEHKCVGAYLKPYYRVNVNGSYSASVPADVTQKERANGINPVFFAPYKLGDTDILNYSGNWARNSGCLPVYGNCISDSYYQYIYINSYLEDYPDNDTVSQWGYIYGYDKGNMVITVSGNGADIHMELDMSVADNVEYIMRGAAAYGLFFCRGIGTLGQSGRDSGASERWIDSEMYCGVIAPDGMTYGDYTQGEGNRDNQVYGWTDSTQTPFDPANIPDTDNTKYDYETQYPSWNLVPSTCNMYVVSQSAIEKLSDIIATAIAGRPDPDQLSTVDYALNNGLTNNPIDTIISVRAYAAKKLPYSSLIPAEAIKCGAWENNSVQGHRLSRTSDSIDFHFRRSTQNGLVAKYGNSFLDYASYTRAELIIPYCGTVALQAADFLNHDINVRIIVDYITGMCTAFVMRDLVAIATVSGSMGVDIPVTGLQNATLAAQRVNAVLQRDNANLNTAGAAVGAVASTIGFAASLATGNVVGALGSGTGLLSSINRFSQSDNQLQKADYDIQHMQAPVKSIQSATPNISFRYEHTCRLIIYRPVLSSDYVPEIYGHTVGFACLINGKVKQFSGLTVGTIDTAGISATDTEKAMIQKAFASGVYL